MRPPATQWKRALLLYPSQLFCADPTTYPVVVRTQLVKLYSYLRAAGVPDVRVLDLELELGRPLSEESVALFLDGAQRLIGAEPYEFVGISCYTSVSYTATLEVARRLRQVQPDALVAVGGYHCLARAEDFAGLPEIDHVVRGDGLLFLDAVFRAEDLPRVVSFTGSAPNPQPMRFDEYPYRHRNLPSVAHVQVSRGCPFQCSFCCEPFMGNGTHMPLEVDAALEQIDIVIRAYQPDKVIIEDLLFGFHAQWRYAFLEALRDRRYSQIFWVEMRADTITERTADLLAQQNFDLTIGLEAASAATLVQMNKAKHPEAYIRSFHQAADRLHAKGVPATFSIMLNFPGETLTGFRETMDNVESALARTSSPYFRFDFFEYAFYPGNETYARIDALQSQLGTEVVDRRWYARRDGTMLEAALCSTPSRTLSEEVGPAAIRTYFRGRVGAVERDQEQRGQLRSQLFWNYRFVRRLQRRSAALGSGNLFARDLDPDTHAVAVGVATLASLHRELTRRVSERIEASHPPSWPLRSAAWEVAFDVICERTRDGDDAASAGDRDGILRDLPALAAARVDDARFERRGAADPQPWVAYV